MSSPSAAAAESAGRRFRRWLIVFAFAAFLLRLAVAWEISGTGGGYASMFRPSMATDLATYMRLGQEIASGTYKGVFYYQPFYYAVFLPLIYLVTGASLWAVVVVQSLLGGLSVWLTGLCAEKISGSRNGALAAAGAAAISTPLLLYAPFHQNETLQSFNLILLLYVTLLTAEKYSLLRVIISALVTGVAILTRGNIWLLLPLCAAAIIAGVFQSTDDRKKYFSRSATGISVYLLVLLAVQSYFIIHNSLITGRLTGPSTAADAVLALGNSVEAPPGGRDPGLPAGPMEYPESFQLMMERVSDDGISVAGQMWEWLLHEPGGFLELQFRKCLLFWDHREIPNNVSLYGEGEYSSLLRWLLPGRSGILLTLSLSGFFLFLPEIFRRRRYWICSGFILIYWLAVAVFYNLSRFRAPILPVAFTGISLLWSYWENLPSAEIDREVRRRRILTGLLITAAAGWLTFAAFDFYRHHLEAVVLQKLRPDGVRLEFSDGRRKYFDHGPFSFGGWHAFTLASGDDIGKKFVLPGGVEKRHFKVHITVSSDAGGALRLRHGGGEEVFLPLKSGVNSVAVDIVPDHSGVCLFTVAGVAGDAALILDTQRNYFRSTLNGGAAGGEWVMRLEEIPDAQR